MNEEGDIPGGSEIDKSQQELTVNRMNTRSKIIELATSAQAIRLYSLSFLISSIVCFFSIDEIVEMFLIPAKNLFVLFINSFSIILIFKLIKKEDLSEMKSEIEAKSEEIENLKVKYEAWKRKLAASYGEVDFENPEDPSHDVTFVMKDGEKVHANSQRLSSHSSVFLKMFSGYFAENNQKEIELEDIENDDFLRLLVQIYHPSTKIEHWRRAYDLIPLGILFKIDWIVDKCEKYFFTDLSEDPSIWNIAVHLYNASEFHLSELQNHCLNQLKTFEDVEEVKNMVDSGNKSGGKYYDDFSDDIKAALDQKMKDLSHWISQ